MLLLLETYPCADAQASPLLLPSLLAPWLVVARAWLAKPVPPALVPRPPALAWGVG